MPHAPQRIRIALLLAGLILAGFHTLWATHNRAGEISIRQEGDCATSLRIRATITTYTKASSTQADRDTLTICWGDGRCEQVARVNGPGNPHKGELLENDTKKNIYIAYHTYPARGTYVISMTDPNRNGGILNVNFPNSEQIKFYVQTTYTFPNPQFQGCNNTPVLLQPPIDIGCVGQPFIHNPNAYDTDGDSLSYHLTTPLQDVGLKVPNYLFPDNINPSPRNNLTINPITGDIVWDAPQRAGEYNLAMIIVEYRDGIPIDTIIRDMQILILECDNLPPLIETPFQEICVVAGQVLEFNVRATAPATEARQKVKLSALGGPFETSINPASFLPETAGYENQPLTKVFRWETDCTHISDQYYSVVFRAVDNFFTRDSTGLSTLKTIRIKVVGPPPEGLRAESAANVIEVSWNKPYLCDDPLDNYFRGFTVWRREGGNAFLPDTCNPGLQGKGYQKLTEFSVLESKGDRYIYYDRTAEPGKTYCYRVLAEFARLTPNGKYAFNLVESLPSREICLLQNRDLPLLLTTSVQSTDSLSGAVQLCWSKPVDLDTLSYPGPYTYQLLRAKGQSPTAADFIPTGPPIRTTSLYAPADTCFTDNGLNTRRESWSYKIQFFTGVSSTKPLGQSAASSTVFLTLQPTDRAMNLTWAEQTTWDNFRYVVERKNSLGQFDSVGTTTTPQFKDIGLENGMPVCYRIRSIGTYGIPNLTDPLLNWSQEACATPVDNVPPCTPLLEVHNICETPADCNDTNALANHLKWKNPLTAECGQHTDIAGYKIYYAPTEEQPMQQVGEVRGASTMSFSHQPESGLTGCYAITAVDARGNESARSASVCVDNCPQYQLPNTFTPNGDGQNDVFIPYPFCFIERIDLKVFNRWGELVFQTNDPHIYWEGLNLQGKPLPSGVYSFICRVFEQRLGGARETAVPLSGFIQLLR
ncbi:MAG: gliding motility-associated C-terminal domain-containing protein [Haliscomenobacter sp.]